MRTRSLSPITDSIKQDELRGISHDKTRVYLSEVLKKEHILSTYKWSNKHYRWSDDQPSEIIQSMTLEDKKFQDNKWINWHKMAIKKYNDNELWIELNKPKQKPFLVDIPDKNGDVRYDSIILLLIACRHYHLTHAYKYSIIKNISIKDAKNRINSRFDKAMHMLKNNTSIYDFNNDIVIQKLSYSRMWMLYNEDDIFDIDYYYRNDIERNKKRQKAIDDYENRNLIYMKERNERMATEIDCLTQLIDLYNHYHD